MKEVDFIKIYDEYASKIFTYCYFKVSSKEEAEDIASQVFLKAWDNLAGKDTGETIHNIKAFLYRIAKNLIIDFYRKSGHRAVPLEDFDKLDIEDQNQPIDDQIDKKILVTQVREKLDTLPEKYREAVTLRFVHDLEIREIAEVMDVNPNNVSVILNRAINKLKKDFE